MKKDMKGSVDLVAGTKTNKESTAFHFLKSGFFVRFSMIKPPALQVVGMVFALAVSKKPPLVE